MTRQNAVLKPQLRQRVSMPGSKAGRGDRNSVRLAEPLVEYIEPTSLEDEPSSIGGRYRQKQTTTQIRPQGSNESTHRQPSKRSTSAGGRPSINIHAGQIARKVNGAAIEGFRFDRSPRFARNQNREEQREESTTARERNIKHQMREWGVEYDREKSR
ncbi:hypothetical protein H2200_002809 [Cladophialophora chaetospira]|uniref:Uncharacterized protein n=1 Tax=Cladophialophora chaetospira TaxID=386627 RepID=A0AA38XG59_9EURO|nr:hypothetical protein H2200_002809 [Cladophialophora chaetospira]